MWGARLASRRGAPPARLDRTPWGGRPCHPSAEEARAKIQTQDAKLLCDVFPRLGLSLRGLRTVASARSRPVTSSDDEFFSSHLKKGQMGGGSAWLIRLGLVLTVLASAAEGWSTMGFAVGLSGRSYFGEIWGRPALRGSRLKTATCMTRSAGEGKPVAKEDTGDEFSALSLAMVRGAAACFLQPSHQNQRGTAPACFSNLMRRLRSPVALVVGPCPEMKSPSPVL